MFDPSISTESWNIINKDCIEFRYCATENTNLKPDLISEITGVFTTANARLRLYDFMSYLHPSQLIYCDTDSVVWLYDSTNPLHKNRNNNDVNLPKSVKFGSGLGQWKSEFDKDDYIKYIFIGGAKAYSYIVSNGKVVVKQQKLLWMYKL